VGAVNLLLLSKCGKEKNLSEQRRQRAQRNFPKRFCFHPEALFSLPPGETVLQS
jgi:hypothetical protein